MLKPLAAALGVLSLAGAAPALAAAPQTTIRGDYVEARTADVYTGPCFSNGEVFITGHQAVLAWKVTEGAWDGVDLSGLTVAAALRGTSTFSEDKPELARSVVIVDQRATPQQREALVAMAKALGGARLSKVVDVTSTRMMLTVESHAMSASEKLSDHAQLHKTPHAPKAVFWAAGVAEILTRPLDETDHTCGNETVAYAPLSKGVDVLPAYTLGNKFQGKGLDTVWNDPNARSSFVGHFAY